VSFRTEELERLKTLGRTCWHIKSHVLPYELAPQNLHVSIREDVLEYFARNGIKWWLSESEAKTRALSPQARAHPTGHLNSSQVACVNHLDPARHDSSLALRLAQQVEDDVVEVLPVEDGGFVAYEWIGTRSYLGERGSRTRGANITSLDALMLARRASGKTCLLVFEWKYLETYGSESVAISRRGTNRVATYAPLLAAPDCPVRVQEPAWLFYEPYYQLMRQTLLAWQMTKAREFGASEWIHAHIVPEGNVALRNRVDGCAPDLKGVTMADAWRSVLRERGRYRLFSPAGIVPSEVPQQWQAWRTWLKDRYLT
jgi:hypothetical protein